MRVMKWLRTGTLSSLFVASQLLLLSNPSISIAQSRSSSPNLEGTLWYIAPRYLSYGKDVSRMQFTLCEFTKKGTVVCLENYLAQLPISTPQFPIPPIFDMYPPYTIISSGTYKQTGRSIHIEILPEYRIDAAIKEDRIEGEIVFNATNNRGEWVAIKNSKNADQTILQVEPSSNTKGRSVIEAQPSSTIDKEAKANELFTKASELMNQGKYSEAIENWNKFIQLDTKYKIMAVAERGRAKLILKDYQGTIADCNYLVQLSAVAIAEYNKIKDKIDQSGSDPVSQAAKAANAANAGLSKEELVRVTTVMQYNLAITTLPNAYYYRGIAKGNLGDKVGACKDFRESCKFGHGTACKTTENFCN